MGAFLPAPLALCVAPWHFQPALLIHAGTWPPDLAKPAAVKERAASVCLREASLRRTLRSVLVGLTVLHRVLQQRITSDALLVAAEPLGKLYLRAEAAVLIPRRRSHGHAPSLILRHTHGLGDGSQLHPTTSCRAWPP